MLLPCLQHVTPSVQSRNAGLGSLARQRGGSEEWKTEGKTGNVSKCHHSTVEVPYSKLRGLLAVCQCLPTNASGAHSTAPSANLVAHIGCSLRPDADAAVHCGSADHLRARDVDALHHRHGVHGDQHVREPQPAAVLSSRLPHGRHQASPRAVSLLLESWEMLVVGRVVDKYRFAVLRP